MPEPRPISRKVIGGAVLLVGAAVALVVLKAKDEPLHVADAAAPATASATPPAAAPPTVTAATPTTAPAGFDLAPALGEAKRLDAARAALARNDPKAALAALDSYERTTTGEGTLRREETLLRIQVLPKVGRKSDALALAFAARDDPSWSAEDKQRLQEVMSDAGL